MVIASGAGMGLAKAPVEVHLFISGLMTSEGCRATKTHKRDNRSRTAVLAEVLVAAVWSSYCFCVPCNCSHRSSCLPADATLACSGQRSYRTVFLR